MAGPGGRCGTEWGALHNRPMSADGTTTDSGRDGAGGAADSPDGAHQGPERWARRGAAGIGMPPGESGVDQGVLAAPPTADGADPDISPSLAGGHAGATSAAEAHRPDEDRRVGD